MRGGGARAGRSVSWPPPWSCSGCSHCTALRHHNPLIDPALFRVRTFSGASLATLLFSVSFGAMLLSIVLWMQDVWGWSPLATGLAVAPGPVMVPLFSFLVTGRLLARFGPAVVIGAGATVFSAGVIWWAVAVQLQPNYLEILPGMLVTGIGVGLTLPSLMSTAASSLPPPSFATGSGVVNMLRQVGFAVGVAMLVAVLGSPHGAEAELSAFRHGWYATAAAGLVGALTAVTLRRGRRPAAPPVTPAGAAPPATAVPLAGPGCHRWQRSGLSGGGADGRRVGSAARLGSAHPASRPTAGPVRSGQRTAAAGTAT